MNVLFVDPEWQLGSRFAPLIRRRPLSLLPVLNETIIAHNIAVLSRKGINRVVVSVSEGGGTIDPEAIKVESQAKLEICVHRESIPRGTAGIIKDVVPLLGDQEFLVINSNLYIEDIHLDELVDFHKKSGAAATVGVRRKLNDAASIECIRLSPDGLVEHVDVMHHSMDRRSPWRLSGIYLFERGVADFIGADGYTDIKEQLISRLSQARLPVHAYEVGGYQREIRNVDDYLVLHRELLEMEGGSTRFEGKKEIAEDVWIGRDTTISPASYMSGPILLGDGCEVADNAQIIGPAVIGDRCIIAESAMVRECVIWHDTSFEKGARGEYCVVGEGLKIPADGRLKKVVAVDDLRIGDWNLMPLHYKRIGIDGVDSWQVLFRSVRSWVYVAVKRIIDVSVAIAMLVLLLPILVAIALLVKIDSRGPVLYAQERCGKNGKRFKMFKFRTMIASAEEMHQELLPWTDSDGPMFKMAADPRVTRIGRFLRETSVDELPQLLNVVTGEMSLVGPRPLIMEEMKFSPSWRDVRLRVKPGITGLWQVQGRSEAPFADWIKYDVDYVMHQSFRLDIEILVRTIGVVFSKIGAY